MHQMMLDQETAVLLRQGRKTQRRWPLPWPSQYVLPGLEDMRAPANRALGPSGAEKAGWGWADPEGTWYPAPIQGPGAVLYVREAWQEIEPAVASVALKLGIPVGRGEPDGDGEWAVCRSALVGTEFAIGNTKIEKWRAAIHCPRWAATQFVRVEALYMHRLQRITVEEVLAEGLTDLGDAAATVAAFVPFWNALNPAAKWETDPMVAAVRFRLLSREEAQGGDADPKGSQAPAAPDRGARRSRTRRDHDGVAAGAAREARGGPSESGPGSAPAGCEARGL